MSEPNSILSSENLPTVVVVTFAAVVLSLAFNFYNLSDTTAVVNDIGGSTVNALQSHSARIDALEERVTAAEAAAAAATAAAATEEPAEATE
jgi:hypothetical protein